MARRKNSRAASGAGSIRQRSDGTWEARYTYTDELGQKQRGSIYGRTQKQCKQRLTAILCEVDEGTFRETQKRYTIEEWFHEWLCVYCQDLKPSSKAGYERKVARYIVPYLGGAQLQTLEPIHIQRFCNRLHEGYKKQKPLSAKSVQCIHGILHTGLKQAVLAGIIKTNPADYTKLPKVKKPELRPLMDKDIARFLEEIQGDELEYLFIVDLFCGLRQSELLGLQWDDVNMEAGTIEVRRQLQKNPNGSDYFFLDETKNGKRRTVVAPAFVMNALKRQRIKQLEERMAHADIWRNPDNLIFTDILGGHLKHHTVFKRFKKHVAAIGIPECRFHDLRHSAAILMLQSECSVKAVQEQMGHYSSSFTMDVYGAVSDAMKTDTRNKMQEAIEQITAV